MDHILARLKGTKMEEIKTVLKTDEADHAKHGLVLRHIWRNVDDPNEIAFIFTAADLERARKFIETAHEQVLKENPNASLPQMLYLKGVSPKPWKKIALQIRLTLLEACICLADMCGNGFSFFNYAAWSLKVIFMDSLEDP